MWICFDAAMDVIDLVVLVSGRGSNLRAIQAAIDKGRCRARIAGVVSDRHQAEALGFAAECGISTAVVRPKDYESREHWDAALAERVAAFEPQLVVLAGFMRIVGPAMLSRFPYCMLNVHPALLPAFPGADGPVQAIAKGVRLSGCTVHLVDAGVDTGPILAQAAVPVLPKDDASSLHARIQVEEHKLLPAVIDAIAKGWIVPGQEPSFSEQCPFGGGALVSPSIA
jgi:phosphoribosylglycinamide formyltransferase-1